MKLSTYKKQLEKDKKEELKFNRDLAFHVGLNIERARIFKGWTQEKLAKKIRTKQPSIARIESGRLLPSLRFMKNIAEALDTYLIPPSFSIPSTKIEASEVKVSSSDTSQLSYDSLPYELLKDAYLTKTQTERTKSYQHFITPNI